LGKALKRYKGMRKDEVEVALIECPVKNAYQERWVTRQKRMMSMKKELVKGAPPSFPYQESKLPLL